MTASTDGLRQPLGPGMQRGWLLANLVAFVVGGVLAGGLLRALVEPYFGVMTSAIDAAVIQAVSAGLSMVVFGAVVGIAQWLVLRRTMRAAWWAPATCIGWGMYGVIMGFVAGGSTSTIGPEAGPVHPLLVVLVVPPLVVLLLGGGQGLLLRREFVGAGWWPLVNVGGLFAGAVFGLGIAKSVPWLASTEFPSARALGLVGVIAGPVYGAITWAYLTELRRRVSRAERAT